MGGGVLNDLLFTTDDPHNIDYDKLPNRFVIKTNHACNTNIIVKDKLLIDKDEINQKLSQWLKMNYADSSGEMQYYHIKPQILVEEYLEDSNEVADIIDYQFWCFNGEVYMINSHIYFRNQTDGMKICRFIYNTDFSFKYKENEEYTGQRILQPKSLKLMIELASKLSSGLPFVRVDFYEINGNPVFGEMTLSPSGGNNHYLSDEDQILMGELLNLNLLDDMGELL